MLLFRVSVVLYDCNLTYRKNIYVDLNKTLVFYLKCLTTGNIKQRGIHITRNELCMRKSCIGAELEILP